MKFEFNANDYIHVKLTDIAKEIYAKYYGGHRPRVTKDGWTSLQFWELMQIFGPHIGLTAPTLFTGQLLRFEGPTEANLF